MLKNRIRALLGQHAIVLPDVSDLYGKVGRLREVNLPDPDGRLLREEVQLLEVLK